MKEKRFSLDKAKQIGDSLGIDWNKIGIEQFRMGLEVELEHGAETDERIPVFFRKGLFDLFRVTVELSIETAVFTDVVQGRDSG